MSAKFNRLKEWYETNEKLTSTVSLIAGFVFDSLTLTRIDSLRDNLWLGTNLLMVGLIIILLNKGEAEGSAPSTGLGTSKHFWLFNILQFSIGNILGGFFILYFRSGTISASWPFLFILLAALVANELFQKRYARLALQLSFFYLAVLSFSIYLVPIFLHSLGPFIFILSGVASLFALWLFTLVLKKFIGKRFYESERPFYLAVAVIFISVNVLYFANLIPPIPLSIKDAGVFQYLSRDDRGSYVIGAEKKSFISHLSFHDTVHLVSGDTLYAYSAIFSPTDLDTKIMHEWQYQNEASGQWVTSTKIPLLLAGGRAGGFRTYSVKANLTAGQWRINIATPRGQILGRINFTIEPVATRPNLIYQVKN